MICKECGYNNSKERLICKKCGANLVEAYKDDYYRNNLNEVSDEYVDYDDQKELDENDSNESKGDKSNNKTKTKSKSKTKTNNKTKEKKVKDKAKKGHDRGTHTVKEKTSGGTKLLIVLLIIIIMGLGAVLAFVGYKYYQKNYNIEVPNVIGLTYEEAELKLAKKDLNIIKKEVVVTDKKEEGIVVKQNKKEGTKVKKGAIIRVKVGVLDNSYKVPNFVGESIEDAIAILTKEGIKYNIVYEESDDSENSVLKQSVQKYSKMDKDHSITLIVSKKSQDKTVKTGNDNEIEDEEE